MPTRVHSFCKVNVGLAVGPQRSDGFHELTTAYQTLALHDHVTISAKAAAVTRITLDADHPGVPCTKDGNCEHNTAYRMVASALDHLGINADVQIAIQKRLPVQGGLGAGSANAAAALLGLERELGRALPGPDRLALAAEIGSDVPLFLLGGTVLGLHRGEAVYPLPDSPPLPALVAIPSVGVSTPQAFRDLDARIAAEAGPSPTPSLTQPRSSDRLTELSRVLASAWSPLGLHADSGRVSTGIANSTFQPPAGREDLLKYSSESLHGAEGDLAGNPLLALVRTGVENDFEDVAFRQHPPLREIKHALLGEKQPSSDDGAAEALYAALSGSGSALFGIYGSSGAALKAQQRVQSLGVRALLTETLPRREYWRRMFA